MHFVSLNFLLFAGVLLVLYYCIPQKLQWWLLLAGSYVFYLAAGVEYLVFILFTTLTTYGATRLMGARLDKLMGSCPQGYMWTGSPSAGTQWVCQGVLDPEGSPRDPLPGSQGRAHGSGNGSK